MSATLAHAFQRDAFTTWLLPSETYRREAMGKIFADLLSAPPRGVAVDVTDDLDAAAIWVAPRSEAAVPSPPIVPRVFDAFRRIDAATPAQPFWYLQFLGARTPGLGGGSALLRARQALTDGARMPTALWTGAEMNLIFYRKLGYHVLERLELDGVTVWWLWREPAV